MKFKTTNGRIKDVKIPKYLIDWQGNSLSKFQHNVKRFLFPYWRYDVVCEEFPVPGERWHIDIINLSRKIMIEVNGIAHLDPNSHFHHGSKQSWLGQIKRDMGKHAWAATNGYVVAEIEPQDMPLTKDFFKRQFDIDL